MLVTYNQADLALLCLRALQAHQQIALQIIIVDNASQDATPELFGKLEGVAIIRNHENVHFLHAANQGASFAKGQYVLFLNSDAIVQKNALSYALRALEDNDQVGAVGGKLILPNGQLQEAGSIIWHDGSSMGYARNKLPSTGSANFRREVDFCSGAFLMVRQSIWNRLGGFDTAFAPAYYEDSDFCLRLQSIGFSIMYDPRICVLHYEYGSSDANQASTLMQRNRHLLVSRHKSILHKKLCFSVKNLLFARDIKANRKRILYLDSQVPLPNLGAGYPRAYELLEALHQQGYFITILRLSDDRSSDWEIWRTHFPLDIEIVYEVERSNLPTFLANCQGFYDIILVSRLHNWRLFIEAIRVIPKFLNGVRLIYDAEALWTPREALAYRVAGDSLAKKH